MVTGCKILLERYCNSPNAGTDKLSPTLASTPTSALAKYIQPIQIIGVPKTGSARVLTSLECMNMLEEKKRIRNLKKWRRKTGKKFERKTELKKKEERERKIAE